MEREEYNTLENLREDVVIRLIHERYVEVSVSVSLSNSGVDGGVNVERNYSLNGNGLKAFESAFYERDDFHGEDSALSDAIDNLKSCLNLEHYNFEDNKHIIRITPREGVSLSKRLIPVG